MKKIFCCICLLIIKLRKKNKEASINTKIVRNVVLPSFQAPVTQVKRKSTIVKASSGVPMQGIAAPIYINRDYNINPIKMIEQNLDLFQLGSKGPSPIDSVSFSLDDSDQLVNMFRNPTGFINRISEIAKQRRTPEHLIFRKVGVLKSSERTNEVMS